MNRDHFEALGFDAEIETLVGQGRMHAVELVDIPVYDAARYVAPEGDPHTVSTVVLFTAGPDPSVGAP